MKVRRKAFFRGLVLVMAFAMTILCFPLNALTAFAYFETEGEINYNYLLIGSNPVSDDQNNTSQGEVVTRLTKGSTYQIPFAYVGGRKDKILNRAEDANILSPSVKVYYNSTALSEEKGEVKMYDKTGDADEYKAHYGQFVAQKEGTYTIRYSYDYKDEKGRIYTHSYDLKVVSTLPKASFNFKDNAQFFIPSVIDLKWAHTTDEDEKDTYRDLSLPMPELVDENGKTIDLLKKGESETDLQNHFVTTLPKDKTGRYVVVSATGGVEGDEITITKATTETEEGREGEGRTHEVGDLYISGDTFKEQGAYDYTIKYSYYEDGQFVASTTKSTKLYPDFENGKPYYKTYDLKLQFESAWNQNAGQTRVEAELPKPIGIVTNDGEDQEVDIRYTVKVFYDPNGTSVGKEIDHEKYADVLVPDVDDKTGESYVLKDPTVFKPLEDGTYNFVYTIYDFYGNKVSSSKGTHYWRNIIDKDPPKPVLYDASDKTGEETNYDDVTYKFKTRANPNAVVVYAIGIDDNYTTNEDFVEEKSETSKRRMIRRIRNDQETKFDIEEYHNKNLVFNYRTTSEVSNAYTNLYNNNFLIQQKKGYSAFTSDEEARQWLLDNGYLIVLDNGNAKHLYKLFKEKFNSVLSEEGLAELYSDADTFESALKRISASDAQDADKEMLKTFKSAIEKLGFAYLPMDKTFGSTTNGSTNWDNDVSGMGYGQYYVDYIVYDDAGNNQTSTKSVYIGSYTDNGNPTLTFASTLRDTYLPDAEITFTVPTASDNGDSVDTNMRIETYYRYLAGDTIIENVKNKDGEVVSNQDLKQLLTDLQKRESTDPDAKKYLSDYDEYLQKNAEGGKTANATGYIRLTDPQATSYTIDLNEVNTEEIVSPATKIQIVTFVYDDSGNIAMYAVSANIANVIDKYAPWLENAETPYEGFGEEAQTYLQGNPITLPTLTFGDDEVAYLSYEVTVNHISTTTDKDGKVKTNITPVTVYNLQSERDERNFTLTIKNATFTPGSHGQYQARIYVVDANNKSAVYFIDYYVEQKISIETPKITTSFDGAEIELDGDENYDPEVGLEIDAPKVTYDIDNGISYEKYKKLVEQEQQETAPDFVIMGVDENNGAIDWYTNRTGRNQRFVAEKREEVDLYYTVNLLVYNRNSFEYVERTIGVDGKPSKLDASGLYYIGNGNTGSREFKFSYNYENERYQFTADNYVYEIYKGVFVDKDSETEEYTYLYQNVTLQDGKEQKLSGLTSFTNATGIATDEKFVDSVDLLLNGVTFYRETLGPYTITVKDEKGPVFSSIYDDPTVFPTSLTRTQIDVPGGYEFDVPGIQVTDRAGIDLSNSRITIRWDMAGNTDSGSESWYTEESLINGGKFKINNNGTRLDGTYTFTYHVEDIYGNESELVKKIVVGDVVEPEISVADSIVAENYKVGSELIIKYSDIEINDPGYGWNNDTMKPVITLVNTSSGGDDIIGKESEAGISFKLDQVGTYELRIEATDEHGNVGTWTKRITISATAQDSTTTYRVIGTVLIVVSVVVLVGVVIYFIVSKVKLDKELKKK